MPPAKTQAFLVPFLVQRLLALCMLWLTLSHSQPNIFPIQEDKPMCIVHSYMKVTLSAVALASAVAVGAFLASGAGSAAAQTDRPARPTPTATPMHMQKSLFDRLGGTYAIAAMVDDYVDNLVKDPVVMANAQVKASVEKAAAAHGVPGLKYQITAFVIEAAGGPYKYHGRNMKETHKTLGITQSEWDASAEVFRRTLAKFSVPTKEQDEVFAIINKTHDDIVVNGTDTGTGTGTGMEKPRR
jgi:hemoglobin